MYDDGGVDNVFRYGQKISNLVLVDGVVPRACVSAQSEPPFDSRYRNEITGTKRRRRVQR